MNLQDARRKAQKVRERAQAATEGPWTADLDCFANEDDQFPEIEACVSNDATALLFCESVMVVREQADWQKARDTQQYRNAEFMAHARTDVPELADLVDAFAGEVEGLESVVNLQKNRTRRRDLRIEALSEEIGDLSRRIETLKGALRRIERWHDEFPATGKFHADGTPTSFALEYGSNGQRDYMRGVARAALSGGEGQRVPEFDLATFTEPAMQEYDRCPFVAQRPDGSERCVKRQGHHDRHEYNGFGGEGEEQR